MKGKSNVLFFCILFVIGFLFTTCSLFNPHPNVKTTLRIVTTGSSRSVTGNAGVDYFDSVYFYIQGFAIDSDTRNGSLHMIGDFDLGSKGGRLDNRGYYDLIVPQSFSVYNDFNPGKYSATVLRIGGTYPAVSLNIDIERFREFKDICDDVHIYFNFQAPIDIGLVFTSNETIYNTHYLWADQRLDLEGISITNNTKEIIVTLSLDISSILEIREVFHGEHKQINVTIKEDWWKALKIDVEVK